MRTLSILLSFFLAACDNSETRDAGTDAAVVALLPTCESLEADGTDMLDPVASTLVGTVVPNEDRLAVPMTQNPALERGETIYRGLGFDRVSRGPGMDRMRRTDIATSAAATGRRSIAWFVQYADFQLVDDESPARIASGDNALIPGGLRAQEAWLPFAISGMNQTLTRIEEASRPYDFGIVSGDCSDNGQENELRWVMELMNGTPGMHVDSGDDDDPIPGPGNDPKDPFDPVAFPAPWLFVPGNHDVLVVGIFLPDATQAAVAIGDTAVSGTRDYRRYYAPITNGTVPADPERRLLSRADIVAALLADSATPGPVGHGYEPGSTVSAGANYTYDAIPNLLRIITIDTNDDTGGSTGLVHQATYDYLAAELEQARTDGVLVMVSSHHATSSIDRFEGQLGSTVVPDAVDPSMLETLVASHPHVVAWLVGHSHNNRVRPVRAMPGTATPGYWEIMTSAMADYPGQARLIELVDNGDDTLSIFVTVVDFDADTCMERRYRRLMVMEWVAAWTDDVSSDPLDMNVELVVPISADARARVTAATGHDVIESETALRGL